MRVIRRAGILGTAISTLYVATVATGLAQTGVGPLPGIPATGNGLIAGFAAAATVPGLLALGIGVTTPDDGRCPSASDRPGRPRTIAAFGLPHRFRNDQETPTLSWR